MDKTFDLERRWIYKITVLADRVARLTGAVALREAGLNLSQWRVVAALGSRDGLTASQVVALTPMDKGIVSRAVRMLADKGLVTRKPSPVDARQTHLHLTDGGWMVFRNIVAELDRVGAHGRPELDGEALDAFLAQIDSLIESYPKP